MYSNREAWTELHCTIPSLPCSSLALPKPSLSCSKTQGSSVLLVPQWWGSVLGHSSPESSQRDSMRAFSATSKDLLSHPSPLPIHLLMNNCSKRWTVSMVGLWLTLHQMLQAWTVFCMRGGLSWSQNALDHLGETSSQKPQQQLGLHCAGLCTARMK